MTPLASQRCLQDARPATAPALSAKTATDDVLTETQNGSVSSRFLLGTNPLLKYEEAP